VRKLWLQGIIPVAAVIAMVLCAGAGGTTMARTGGTIHNIGNELY